MSRGAIASGAPLVTVSSGGPLESLARELIHSARRLAAA